MMKESPIAKLLKKEEKKRNHQNNKQSSLDTVKIKEKYGDLIENTHVAVATIDKKGKLIYVNNGICSLSGYSKNELLGRPFVDFLHPDDKKKMIKLFLFALFKSEGKIHFEFRFIHKNSTIITCCTSPTIFRFEGKIKGFHAIIQDITRYKKTEEQLKNSDECFKNLIELAPDSIVTVDLKGYITSCNSAATHIFKYSKDDLVGKHFSKIGIFHVKDIPKYLKLFVSILRGKRSGIYELTVNDKDGTARIVETHIGLTKENNKISGILAITRDITERKQAEAALKESEEKFRTIFENNSSAMAIIERDTTISMVNRKYCEMSLYEEQDVIGKSWTKQIHPEDLKRMKEYNRKRLIDPKNAPSEYEFMFYRKDGEIRHCLMSVGVLPTSQKIVTSFTDITERKKAQEEIKRLAKFPSENPNPVLRIKKDGEVVYSNKAGFQILDFWKTNIGEEVPERWRNIISKKFASKNLKAEEEEEEEEELNDKIFSFVVSPVADEGYVNLYGRDITDRKRAEEKIRGLLDSVAQERDRLSSLVNSITDEVWFADTQKNFTLANPVALREFGYISTNSINVEEMARSLKVYRPDGSPRPVEEAPPLRALKGEIVHNMEEIVRTPVRGELRYRQVNAAPVRDTSGNIIGSVSVVRDITKRKKAEEEIKKERDFSKSIVDTAQAIVIVLDTEGKIVSFNPYMEELSGYKIDEVKGKDWFTTFLPECDYDQIRHLFKKSLRGIQTRGNINPIIAKDGREILIEWYDKTLKDKDGKIIGVLAIGQDVTERKKTEEMLKKSEERYKRLFNSSPELILETDEEGNIFAINPMMAKSIGVPSDKLIGKNIFNILPSEIAEQRARIAKKALKEGKNQEMEDVRNGRHFHTIYVPIIYPNGKKTVQAIVKDITDQKKAEETLQKSEEKYRTLIENADDQIFLIDETLKVLSLNTSAARTFGKKPEEVVGESILDLFPKEIANDYSEKLIKVFKTGEKYKSETKLITGEIKAWISTNLNPVKDQYGKVVSVLGVARDITEHKQAEETLAQQNEALSQLNYFSIELSMLSPEDNIEAFIIKQIKEITGAEVAIFSHYNPADRTLIAQHIEMDPGLLEKVVSLLGKQVTKIHSVVSDEMYRKMTTEIIGRRRTLHEASFGAISRPVGAAIQALLKVDRFIGLAYIIEGELYGTSLLAMKKDQPDPPKQILENFIFLATMSLRRKRVEKDLQQSEEKYRFLFNDVPVGIGIVDESGRVVDSNQCIAEMFRMTSEEFKAINVKSLYANPKDRERLLNLLNKEGKVIDWECSFKRKDGTAFFAILNTDVIEREGQKLNLTSLRDITERKVAEEKIKKQNVQLKKLDDVKTDFLNTTSHELRTPVASIKGYIQMLLKQTLGEITEEQKKALEVLLRNTNRLDHLIQDILDISRLESGTMKFITEKTGATKMIKEIAETMQASADLKRIKIKIDIQEGIPDLMVDGERIKQVLMNLVDNAIKFSPDGSMIHIKARKEKEDVLFEVQDFGRGIPKNKQKKIFERFYQVDSGIDRKFGGVGLGLTISKKIIETYGGQIWVDSTVGKGSSFKFLVPLQSTKNIEDDLQEIYIDSP